MVPPLHNESVFDEEVELRTDVRIAIELALDDILEQKEQRDITSVEEEKLTYFAIHDLDLPLTYSWYLAGAHTAAQVDSDMRSPWEPGPAFGSLRSQETNISDRIQELRAYFCSNEFMSGYTLRDIWFTDKFDFLRDYYRESAPKKYRNLYIHSLDIREQLWDLSDILKKESNNTTLSDFGSSEPTPLLAPSAEKEIRYSMSDFHTDIAKVDELNPIKEDVVESTGVIKQILSKLTRLETATAEQQSIISNNVHDFFYYYIWKYPALAISADTAHGPNAEVVNSKRLLEFDSFDETLQAKTDDIERRSRETGLLPDENGSMTYQRTGVFADFEGFEGENEEFDHDRAGLEPAGEYDASGGA